MTTEFRLAMKDGKPTGNIITPMFRGAYLAFFEPRGVKNDANSKKKYSCAQLYPEGTNFDVLKGEIKRVATEKWGAKAEDVLRKQQNSDKRIFKDQSESDAAGFEDGCIYLQASNEKKPGLVGRKAGPDGKTLIEITDPEAVWSGDYFIATIRPFAWEHPVGGKGVSLSLQNVQLIKKGDHLGGGRTSPSDEFEAMEGDDMDALDEGASAPASKDPFA